MLSGVTDIETCLTFPHEFLGKRISSERNGERRTIPENSTIIRGRRNTPDGPITLIMGNVSIKVKRLLVTPDSRVLVQYRQNPKTQSFQSNG